MIGYVLRSQSRGRVQRLVGARFLKPAPGDPWDSELSDQNVGFRSRRLMGREFLKPRLPRLTEKPHLVPRSVLGHRASRNANSIGGPEADGRSCFQLVGLWWGLGEGKPQFRGSCDGNFSWATEHPAQVPAGAPHLDRLQFLVEAEDKLGPVFHSGNVEMLGKKGW